MKRKFSKILKVSVALVMVLALAVAFSPAPVLADVSQPDVELDNYAISTAGGYTITFDAMFALDTGTTIAQNTAGTVAGTSPITTADGDLIWFSAADTVTVGAASSTFNLIHNGVVGASQTVVDTGTFAVAAGDIVLVTAGGGSATYTFSVATAREASAAAATDLTTLGAVAANDYWVFLGASTLTFTSAAETIIYNGTASTKAVDDTLDVVAGDYVLFTTGAATVTCTSVRATKNVLLAPAAGDTLVLPIAYASMYFHSGDTVWQNGVSETQAAGSTLAKVGTTLDGVTFTAGDMILLETDMGATGKQNPDSVSVVFPAGTTVPASMVVGTADDDVTLTSSGEPMMVAVNIVITAGTRTVEIFVGVVTTKSPDHLTVAFLTTGDNEVINPDIPGIYTLKVKTSEETTKVESYTYAIGVPGVVTRTNADGNYVGSYNTLTLAIDAAAAEDTLTIGAGTYIENITITLNWLTIEGIDGTIIEGNVELISGAHVTLDTLNIKGTIEGNAGNDTTVKNCAFEHQPLYEPAGIQISSSGDRLSVVDCTFDTTYSTYADTGIELTGGEDVTIDGCTFTMDAGTGTVSTQDKAINVTGGTTAVTGLTVKNCVVEGDRGTGYYDHSSANVTATVRDSTFDGLQMAFDISNDFAGSTLAIRQNTITDSYLETKGAIDITECETLVIAGNTIEDNDGYSVYIRSGVTVSGIKVVGNNLVDNVKGLRNATTTTLTGCINNWWGDASGPTISSTNPDGTGDKVSSYVTYKPWLTASADIGKAATAASSLDAETTVGVKVDGLTTAADVIWVAKYAANPVDVEPTYPALEDAWFDVYISGGTLPAVLKFYADDIDANTDAYFWSKLENKWIACEDQAASASGGYVWVNISTGDTEPAYTDLSGMPFVLCVAPAAAEDVCALTAPEAGATVPILTNVPFTWESVLEATSYDLVISASPDLSDPIAEVSIAGTAYIYAGTLTDSTPYFWRVTAMREATVEAISDVATFLAKLPAEAVTPVVTVEAAPPAVVTVEPAEITITPPEITVEAAKITVEAAAPAPAPQVTVEAPEAEAVPMWALLSIIIIGAVLVIALIVLVVRTRRVA